MERVEVIETSSSDWKSDIIAVILYSHGAGTRIRTEVSLRCLLTRQVLSTTKVFRQWWLSLVMLQILWFFRPALLLS